MIRPININLNAAHPELPLVEATTFTGAPSSVFIRGVPKAVGNWSITAVSVAVTYPDNTTTARAAVESAEGVWVATIPGTATSGRTAAGFKIVADGTDENGDAVTGYVLGFADFSVLSFTPVPAPGGTFYFLRYFDQAPATPKEGDVAKIDGVLKFYNGSAWETFAASVTLDNTVTRTSANGVKSSGIWSAIWGALSALPTGFASLYDWVVDALALKANDNAVVHLTGEQQTISAVLQLMSTLYAESGVESHGDYRLTWRVGGYYAGTVKISQDTISVQLAGENEPRQYKLQAGGGGTLALLENIAPAFVHFQSYGVNELCTSFDADSSHVGTWLYKCIAATDGSTPPETDTTHWTLATVEDVLAALRTAIAGKADASAIPYSLVTKTVSNNAVTLDDRASNAVTISTTLSPNTLTINFPTATSGKVRDFAMRLNIAAGVTAPEIAWPQGVTLENNGGEVPEIADGGTGGSSTILYFSETENNGTTAKFLVKGETLTAIAQA